MGSRSRSRTSSTNTTQEIVTNNVDNRLVEGDGDIGGNINLTTGVTEGSNNIHISTSDFGALDAASEISDNAFDFASFVNSEALNTVDTAVASSTHNSKKALEIAEAATRDEGARTTNLLIVGGVVVALAVFVIRGKK